MMNKLITYFTPELELSFFEKLKTRFLIAIILIGLSLLLTTLIVDLLFPNDNFVFSFFSKLGVSIFSFSVLFVLKKKGVQFAGNTLSLGIVILLLVSVNIFNVNIPIMYKYLQGFYSVFALLVISTLYASRLVLLMNSALIFLTTTHVYYYSMTLSSGDFELFQSAYIYHTTALLSITVFLYYTKKFTDLSIVRANKDTQIIQLQNESLKVSEDDLKSSNEELRAASEELFEVNSELVVAKEKAEESGALKTEFLNNLSHEVRTPMNGILGFSGFLENENLSREDQLRFVSIIKKSGVQLVKIISDILEISELETKQAELLETEFDINRLLDDLFLTYTKLAQKKGLDLVLKKTILEKDSNIRIDEVKLNTILKHLLENAIKYTNEGSVEFSCSFLKKEKSAFLQIYVKDTGIGIKPENHKLIFKRFSQEEKSLTQKTGGLGLGLSIVKGIVDLFRGEITLESQKGKGTRFLVTIPLRK